MKNLLIRRSSEANFAVRYADSTATAAANAMERTRTPGSRGTGVGGSLVSTRVVKKSNKFASGAGRVGFFLGKNKVKAGLAGVGLVGAGMLASKALSRPESLQSKLKKTLKKNPQLNQAANMASKMFR